MEIVLQVRESMINESFFILLWLLFILLQRHQIALQRLIVPVEVRKGTKKKKERERERRQ